MKKTIRLQRSTVRTLRATELERGGGGMMITPVLKTLEILSRISELNLDHCC